MFLLLIHNRDQEKIKCEQTGQRYFLVTLNSHSAERLLANHTVMRETAGFLTMNRNSTELFNYYGHIDLEYQKVKLITR